MKTTLVLLVAAVVLGIGSGIGAAYLRYGRPVAVYAFDKPTSGQGSAELVGPSEVRPRAAVGENGVHDFGIMSRNERRSHPFVISNRGNADLEISFVDKTCQCTDVTPGHTVIPPGEQAAITVSWQPSSFNPKFEQTARFRTNDPGRLELDLTVKGRVQQIVQIEPRAISFDNVGKDQARSSSIRLFSFRDADLKVADTEWLDPETSGFFDVSVQPLPEEVVANEPGALVGFDIQVELRPGMPVGRFQQRLRVHLSYADLGVREIPILGSVVGNVSIYGKGFDNDLWNLGLLPGDQPHQRKLWIRVKGDHASPIEMSVTALDPPDVLHAEIQPPKENGSAIFTLTLNIKPSGDMVNRIGNQQGELGHIEIATNLPEHPKIDIPVSFGIESNLEAR